jgi:TolB protein
MRCRVVLGAIAAAAVFGVASRDASAQDPSRTGVRIGLTYQAGTRPGVLVLPGAGAHGDSLRAIIQRDLDHGDRVLVIGLMDSPVPPGTTGATISWTLMQTLGVAAVVEPSVTSRGTLRLVLHDVAKKAAVESQEYPLPPPALGPAWRMAVHRAADEFEGYITGTRGVAASRILFVRGQRIWQVDSDGANPAPVSEEGALSPAWHPDGSRFAYSQFTESGVRVMTRRFGGPAEPVPGTTRGMSITPAWSPDGRTLVFATGDGNGTDLVAVNPDGTNRRLLTVGRGSENVSPTLAPDGRRVAFTSGRSGHPEVYIADMDGTNAELLTPYLFGDRSYRSNPSWSPDGRTVAFQSRLDGTFQLMTIALRDRSMKQLTSDGANEDPSWAPDGRHLVFVSTRTGRRELHVLDVESGRVRQLTTGGDARMPAWSPRLP